VPNDLATRTASSTDATTTAPGRFADRLTTTVCALVRPSPKISYDRRPMMTVCPSMSRRNCAYSSGTSHGIPSPLPMTRSVDIAPMMIIVSSLGSSGSIVSEPDNHRRLDCNRPMRQTVRLRDSVDAVQDSRKRA
jgi:hypothetical protein